MQNGWSRKIYLELPEPSQEDNRPDSRRILEALERTEGLENRRIRFSVQTLRSLYPLCQEAAWKITATLGFDGDGFTVTRLEAGNTEGEHYGLCADLGSTTIAMQLVDMRDGSVKAETSVFNPQIAFGEDILTRIFYGKDQPEHQEQLRRAVLSGFAELLDRLSQMSGIWTEHCASLILAGNTAMIHFLLGTDAFCVFQAPYAVRTLDPGVIWARDLDIGIDGFVYCYPGRANYLGGDILSGVLSVGMAEQEGISVFLDIGTNGELVIGNRDFLIAGAGAAGPALEGASVRTGMRAEPGAVDRAEIRQGEILIHTIQEAPPRGICGSGIVDLLAQMFLSGWLDFKGKLVEGVSPLISFREEEPAVEYAPGLFFYQRDIDEFLKTKAAAGTMVEYMTGLLGIGLEDVERFYVAGAFGTHISKESGITIGLYPDIDRERLILPGNTSLTGARCMLLDLENFKKAERIAEQMEYVQFGAVDDFLHLMTAAQAIPHTDFRRYPTVMRELSRRGRALEK